MIVNRKDGPSDIRMDGPSITWKRVLSLSLYIYTVLLSKLDPLELSSRGIGDGWPVIDDEA